MSDVEPEASVPRTHSGALLGVIGATLLLALGGLVWSYTLNSRLTRQEAAMNDANQQNAKLAAELRETNARLKVATDELGKCLGLTQKQLDAARGSDSCARGAGEQKAGDGAEADGAAGERGVKRPDQREDRRGRREDRPGQDAERSGHGADAVESMKGDLSDHSSLIARNHDELEVLKHKGDRNYYEFTLVKGQKKPVGTVSLELKKADQKKSRFTLVVYADDRSYEKKDRNVNEPLQFYSGKDPGLYEIVVNTIGSKNQISGYLSTPKTAGAPPSGQ